MSGIIACAAKPVLNIQYNVPDAIKTMEGRRAGIVILDQRSDKSILDKAAQDQLKDFTGKFVFLTEPYNKNEQDTPLGMRELFQEAMGKRFESLGATISGNPEEADVVLRLMVKTFTLRFIDGSWKANIAYEARLLKDDRIRAREEVEGSAERVKIIGTGDADKVMGKLFTDTINKLNLDSMLAKAGMD
jgi:hypothetical protein